MNKQTKILYFAVVVTALFAISASGAPDFFSDGLCSDGIGHIDTKYKLISTGAPRTSRIDVDYSTSDYGRGTAPGPVAESTQPALFGYTDSSKKFIVRYSNATGQVWHDGGYSTVAGKLGDVSISVNYIDGTMDWGGTAVSGITVASPNKSFYLFARNNTSAVDIGVYCLRDMKIYETSDDGVTEMRVHWFRPCCVGGKAALYDADADMYLFPSTDGFTLSGYDIALAAGALQKVTEVCSAPRTLSLAAGSHLVFDGVNSMSPGSEVVLPESGCVGITLLNALGKGRYTLMDNLPVGFDVSVFSVDAVPAGFAGTLSKMGSSLVMTLTAIERDMPDVVADTLHGDAHGYIDTGYCDNTATYPKTARITFDFNTTDLARGTAPGPVSASAQPAVFGYLEASTRRLFFRYDSAGGQWWHDGGYKNISASDISGDISIDVDYLGKTAAWGSTTGSITIADVASARSHYIFAYNKQGSANMVSVFDFRNMKIYETDDGSTQTLMHDFVPCVKAGAPGVYDKVGGGIRYPILSTNGFTVAGMRWRLKVNGEVIFTNGTVSVECPATDDPPNVWLLVRDSDNVEIASGEGASAEFEMPSAAATLRWRRIRGFRLLVR